MNNKMIILCNPQIMTNNPYIQNTIFCQLMIDNMVHDINNFEYKYNENYKKNTIE